MDDRPNLTSPAVVKSVLQAHGLRPKKRLGQNFLVDRNVLDKIIAAADIATDSPILEVGPGLGTVTAELAAKSSRVVAVETDKSLVPILREVLAGFANTEVVEADFLTLPLREFLSERAGEAKWTVVANLPYYITTPIITRLLDVKHMVRLMVVMVQKEVAQRLIADAGTADYGSVSVFVQYHCEVEIAAHVSRNVFFPPPEVDSALVKLTVREKPVATPKDEQVFFAVVRAAFGQRRKTVLNALSALLPKPGAEAALQQAGIDPIRRGETLDLVEFCKLADAVGAL